MQSCYPSFGKVLFVIGGILFILALIWFLYRYAVYPTGSLNLTNILDFIAAFAPPLVIMIFAVMIAFFGWGADDIWSKKDGSSLECCESMPPRSHEYIHEYAHMC